MNNKNEEIKYVYQQLETGNYTLLPNNIAIGKVYKIPYYGNLVTDGLEIGYLYLEKNSGIKEHPHIDNIERYQLLQGTLAVAGEKCTQNICFLNQKHSIDPVSEPTIIQTCKINALYHNLSNISPKEFNHFVNVPKIKKRD